MMTKDFLLRLTEEHYGAGAFPVYGRLLEEQRLTRGGPLLPMWHCTAALRRAFGGENVLDQRLATGTFAGRDAGKPTAAPLSLPQLPPPDLRCPRG